MALQAGVLRHRVDIQRQQQTQDGTTGEMVVTWVNVWPSVPAEVRPSSGREYVAAQAKQSQITASIRIRYRAGIVAGMRLLHGATVYNIEAVLPDQDSGIEFLMLPCSSGVNDGQ